MCLQAFYFIGKKGKYMPVYLLVVLYNNCEIIIKF